MDVLSSYKNELCLEKDSQLEDFVSLNAGC